jgi:hypothetical protein
LAHLNLAGVLHIPRLTRGFRRDDDIFAENRDRIDFGHRGVRSNLVRADVHQFQESGLKAIGLVHEWVGHFNDACDCPGGSFLIGFFAAR